MYMKLVGIAIKLMGMVGITKGQDKVLHVIAGLAVTSVVAYFFGVGYGLLAGFIAGVGKEMFDEYRVIKGKRAAKGDFFDLYATLAGTVFAGGLIVAFS